MWNPNVPYRPGCNYNRSYSTPWYYKRKLALVEKDLPPQKMHITEEKMVSQLNGIHLSPDFTPHGHDPDAPHMDTSLPKLVLSEELKSIQKAIQEDQLLPRQLLENCRKPTNALVLWQPPAGELGKYLGVIGQHKEPADDELEDKQMLEENDGPPSDVNMIEDDNNNGSMSADLNGLFVRTV